MTRWICFRQGQGVPEVYILYIFILYWMLNWIALHQSCLSDNWVPFQTRWTGHKIGWDAWQLPDTSEQGFVEGSSNVYLMYPSTTYLHVYLLVYLPNGHFNTNKLVVERWIWGCSPNFSGTKPIWPTGATGVGRRSAASHRGLWSGDLGDGHHVSGVSR